MIGLSLLREMQLFHGLDDAALTPLTGASRLERLAPGELVFQQDDAVALFYVLVDGQMKITRSTAGGKEQTLYIVEPGEPFCFCTIFGIVRQPVNAMALKPSTVLALSGDVLERSARDNPVFLLNILEILNRRLMNSMQMIEDLALRGIPQRLASFLLQMARLGGADGEGAVRLDVPKHEIARILGTTPETLSRVLARFTGDGLITMDRRRIAIEDQEALRELADS